MIQIMKHSILLLIVFVLAACGESASELYFRGMKIEGDASRKECKLVYDQEANAHLLDSEQVLSCLRRTEEALVLYEKAASMGQRGIQFVESRERAKARKQRLESMLKVIREMEQEQLATSK